ncbi:MAG: hypothetical protein CMO55_26335 [Verrucomicrobiales bacterium]|nr:hypothetical protein [Verrucomicrobiales bacterium]
MTSREQDEVLWRYLGGQPATAGLSRELATNPAMSRRLAELALIECAIRDDAVKADAQRTLRRRILVPMISSGVALLALLLAGGGWFLLSRPEVGTPIAERGNPNAKQMISAVREGKMVEVKEKPFRVAFAREETNLEFSPGSEMKLEETKAGGKRVRLNKGRIDADVAPQEMALEVITPHLEAKVLGTQFNVDAEEGGSRLFVDEGLVEVLSKSLTKPRNLSQESGWWQMASGRGVSVAGARRVSSPPEIDGVEDQLWESQPVHPNAFLGENKVNEIDSEEDHSSSWRAVWDDEALYVLIEVVDNADGRGNDKPWSNDSAEIFIDADHGRTQKLDGVNDYLLFFDPSRTDIFPGIGSVEVTAGMDHVTRRTSQGFRTEVKIPWSDLGVRPREGFEIGFNVASNDTDETEGKRRSQLTWTPKVSGDFGRPDRMGVLILSGAGPP